MIQRMENSVLLSQVLEGNILLITINRPQALNAINYEVMSGLGKIFEEHKNNKDLVGVIITGSGEKSFVAGADITQFVGVSPERAIELSKFGHHTFNSIENYHIPVLAMINGFALGGGCELAMACHIRIASPNSRFGQPEVNLGLIPGYGGSQRLVHLVGKSKATEMLLTGDPISADEALRYGLITHVVEQSSLLEKAKEILLKIGQKGPKAIAKTIQLVNMHNVIDPAFVEEYMAFGDLMVSDECKEGVDAFLNKRKPDFRKSN
jgi:enoyl-CoA hydratase